MNLNSLCINTPEDEVIKVCNQHKGYAEKYIESLISYIDNEKTKEKITKIFGQLEAYVIDAPSKTPIKRKLCGEQRPFNLTMRAVAYVREQIRDPETKESSIKSGIAIRINEYCRQIICHEINHALSKPLFTSDKEGSLYKEGMMVLKIKDDKYVDLTGNAINEGMTDAIAEVIGLTIDENLNDLKINNSYNGLRKACKILLGENLKNDSLLNAYFGDIKDLNQFIKEFDSVMKDENITFKEILKTDFKIENCIDGVNFNDEQLIEIACKYRYYGATNLKDLKAEKEFLTKCNIDVNTETLRSIESKIINKMQNNEPCM